MRAAAILGSLIGLLLPILAMAAGASEVPPQIRALLPPDFTEELPSELHASAGADLIWGGLGAQLGIERQFGSRYLSAFAGLENSVLINGASESGPCPCERKKLDAISIAPVVGIRLGNSIGYRIGAGPQLSYLDWKRDDDLDGSSASMRGWRGGGHLLFGLDYRFAGVYTARWDMDYVFFGGSDGADQSFMPWTLGFGWRF